MSVTLRRGAGRRDLLALAAALPGRYPCLLQSVAHGTAQARWDILFAFPQHSIRLDADGRTTTASGDEAGGFLAALDAGWQRERVPHAHPGLPFRGGWVVYLGYELAQQIEPSLDLPAAPDAALPTALAIRCPAAILIDHAADQTILIAESGHEDLLELLQADLSRAESGMAALPALAGISEDEPQQFLASVARIHDYLRAGDVFQVNLSRQWLARFAEAPLPAALHAALRHANPAPFAGLLQQPDWALASSSPERLVEVRGERVQVRPIAGTRARIDGDDDAARIRELIEHPKERAEHVMLIDLERNDLGRICSPGSIHVDELMAVESYAHVHHIVSNVRGRLRADTTPGQVIGAVFPGGTITGCPKVRCMQIIAELEGVGRGPYTGSLGYLNRDGDMDLNILIRTLGVHGDQVRLRAGAGIVADSHAPAELAETRAKARGLLRAIGGTG